MPWQNLERLESKIYTCGHCGSKIASNEGFYNSFPGEEIYICHACGKPTYFSRTGEQIPGELYGYEVNYINSEEVKLLYEEARRCITVNAYTASVMCCRKLIMNIAVSLGAKEGERFITYVEYLRDTGYIPPNGKEWVDAIREKGNEANHEIKIMKADDAKMLIDFIGMLMKFIYEFPAKINKRNE